MKREGNINSWAGEIGKTNPELSNELRQDKKEQYRKLKESGLPQYNRVSIELSDFLNNPESAISELDSNKFFVSLVPKDKNMDRYGKAGLNIEQVKSFVEEKVDHEDIEKYEIVVNEYFENMYGGNMVIGENGEVYVEFKMGEQTEIARGKIIPEYIITREKFTDSFRYSFEDKNLREIVFKALLSIPHDGEGRELKFMHGYYEFVIVKRDEESEPEPIFIDYNDNPSFNLDWKQVNIDASKYEKKEE